MAQMAVYFASASKEKLTDFVFPSSLFCPCHRLHHSTRTSCQMVSFGFNKTATLTNIIGPNTGTGITVTKRDTNLEYV